MGILLNVLCEVFFYGFYIFVLRKLSKYCNFGDDFVFILVLDFKFGVVVKLRGDFRYLEFDLDN